MAITITITDKEIDAAGMSPASLDGLSGAKPEEKDGLKIVYGDKLIKLKLNIRKTLDNNIVIYDHPSIDIIIIPTKNKIFTVPKQEAAFDSYPSQDRYFKFLDDKGALVRGTTRSGVILNSLESFYPPNNKIDVLQVILLLTKRFMDKENEFISVAENYEENVEDMYVNPDEEDVTELGEIPQKARKGNVNVYQTAYGILYRV